MRINPGYAAKRRKKKDEKMENADGQRKKKPEKRKKRGGWAGVALGDMDRNLLLSYFWATLFFFRRFR